MQDAEERLHLRRRQRCGRLVQYEEADRALRVIEGAGDRDGAAVHRTQLGDWAPDVHLHADVRHQPLGVTLLLVPQDAATATAPEAGNH